MNTENRKNKAIKRFLPAIITAGILAVAVIVLPLIMPKDEKAPGDTVPTTPPPSVISAADAIVNRKPNDVKSVEIDIAGGESFAIDYALDADGFQVATMRNADPGIEYSQNQMTTLPGYVAILSSVETVGEVDNLADFGFDAPQRKIKTTYIDGEVITILIGDNTNVAVGNDRGVYVCLEGSNKVYTIGAYTMEILMMQKSDYRDFAIIKSTVNAEDITYVSITRPGRDTITVEKKSDEEKKAALASSSAVVSNYKLTSPISCEGGFDVSELLLEKVAAIKVKSLVEDTPTDLAKYGLDNPYKLSYETDSGTKLSILIGDRASEGGRYIMSEDAPAVILTESDITFLDISYVELMHKLVFFYTAENVSSIDYELADGSRHTFKLDGGDTISGKYDGKALSSDNANNLFVKTIRFTAAGEVEKSAKISAPAIKVTLTQTSGSKSTLELCAIDNRRYAVKLDGATPFVYVMKNEVTELLDAFDILSKGGSIPDITY